MNKISNPLRLSLLRYIISFPTILLFLKHKKTFENLLPTNAFKLTLNQSTYQNTPEIFIRIKSYLPTQLRQEYLLELRQPTYQTIPGIFTRIKGLSTYQTIPGPGIFTRTKAYLPTQVHQGTCSFYIHTVINILSVTFPLHRLSTRSSFQEEHVVTLALSLFANLSLSLVARLVKAIVVSVS